jgi:phosphatidate phosphatase PAH1
MFFLKSCLESAQIISSNFEDNTVLSGVSDTIVVKQKDGKYKSTPFLATFGPYHPIYK